MFSFLFSLFPPELRPSRYKNIKSNTPVEDHNVDCNCKLTPNFVISLNEMVVKCYFLSSSKIVLFLCDYLQMALSRAGSIANIQHLPKFFHHFSYLNAILCKPRKHLSTLSFVPDAAQPLSHVSSLC